MKKLLICLICFGSLLVFNKSNAQTVDPNYVDGKIYFKFVDSYPADFTVDVDHGIAIAQFPFLLEMAEEFGIVNLKRPFYAFNTPRMNRIVEVEFDSIAKIDLLQKRLKYFDFIEYVDKKEIVQPFSVPNDPYYSSNVGSYNLKWYLDMIKAEKAWDIATGNSQVKVAIVDNAVWGEHPDLQMSGNLQYNVGLGKIGSAAPPDSIPQDKSSSSSSWSHGTHCAGLVGAVTNNETGIASIGGGVTLMGVNASDNNKGTLPYGPDGVTWAVANGANVLSMSYGSPIEISETVKEVYHEAAKSAILIVAAGNSGHKGNEKTYPAAMPEVISVASVDIDGKLSYFSEYGDWINIAAPGGYGKTNVVDDKTADGRYSPISTTFSECTLKNFTPQVTGNYDLKSGTSQATPMVAGLVGLMLSKNPHLTKEKVLSYLQTTSIPLTISDERNIQSGYIDAERALKAVCDSLPTAKFSASVVSGNAPLTVIFEDTSSLGNSGTLKDRKWLFPGADTAESVKKQQEVTYEIPGIYDVTLVVSNNYTTIDSKGQSFYNQDSLAKKSFISVAPNNDTLYSNVDSVMLGAYQKNFTTLNIISDTLNWRFSKDSAWFSVKIDSLDKKGNALVTITTNQQNPWAKERKGLLKVYRETDTVEVIVAQSAATEVLKMNKSIITPGRGTRSTAINVTSNLEWAFDQTTYPDWITWDASNEGSGNKVVNIKTEANNTFLTRTAQLKLKGGNIEKILTVKQAGRPCTQELDKDTIVLDSIQNDSVKVVITTFCDWKIQQVLPDFIEVSPTEGTYQNNIVTIKTKTANTTTARKKGEIRFAIVADSATTANILYVEQKCILGVDDDINPAIKDLKVYPNPVSDILIVEDMKSIAKSYQVIDISGRVFVEAKAEERTELNLNLLAKGSYLLKIVANDGNLYTRKIMKQ